MAAHPIAPPRHSPEKAKMRAKGEAYLSKAGVMKDNPLSYCTVGRDEVARGSLIGSFLRVR